MASTEITRKEFITLTFRLVGGAAVAGAALSAACSSSGGGSCSDQQVASAATDINTHVHTLTVDPSLLNATTDQTLDTSDVLDHMHSVTLTAANLATLKGGAPVTVTAASASTASIPAHTHSYAVTCTASSSSGGGY